MKKLLLIILLFVAVTLNGVTLTSRNSKVTISGTSINTIDFDNALKSKYGTAIITVISGTAVNITSDGTTVTTSSELLSSSGNNVRTIVDIQHGVPIQLLGGAGGEVLNITISNR